MQSIITADPRIQPTYSLETMIKGDIISGRVMRAHGRLFWVQIDSRQILCALREKVKKIAESKISPVVVGDKVEIELLADLPEINSDSSDPQGIIIEVAPRQTRFSRPKRGREDLEQIVAANIEQMLIVTSVALPDFKQHLIDRFLVAARSGNLTPIVIINKIDLDYEIDLEHIKSIYEAIGIAVLFTSVVNRNGLQDFQSFLKDKTSVIAGQSGVGKSSLLNSVEPALNIRIGEVSEYSKKGIHTTTSVQMYPLSFGGFVVDTPGLKYLGLWGLETFDLQNLFPEFERFLGECRFSDCLHQTEPGCAVRKAVEKGLIHNRRYESYLALLEEQKQQNER